MWDGFMGYSILSWIKYLAVHIDDAVAYTIHNSSGDLLRSWPVADFLLPSSICYLLRFVARTLLFNRPDI